MQGRRCDASVRRGPKAGHRWEPSLLALDVVAIAIAYALAVLLRFDGEVPGIVWQGYLQFLPAAMVVQLASLFHRRLYRLVWSQAEAGDARRLVAAVRDATVLLFLLSFIHPGRAALPLSVPLLAAALLLLLLGATRFRHRIFARRRIPTSEDDATRVIVVGATGPTRSVVQQMRADPTHGLVPVAVIDGAPSTWGRSIADVPVVGPLAMLPVAAERFHASQVLLAFDDEDGSHVRRAVEKSREVGLSVRVFPSVREVVGAAPTLHDIREISIDDLLGRPQVEIDLAAIRASLHDRRVLITGAGGSIGSEIARQVATFGPQRLILLDHDETHLHDTVAQLEGNVVSVLADIRDHGALLHIFRSERPSVVFHAAAHKHVPILEAHPIEAVRTNVLGTENVLDAAAQIGVERFVAISTDKAVNPSSVMGASKRISEALTLAYSPPGARYTAVRFGNVLGSRGSVVPTFLRQIQAGGPVTVTHPEMTRYFMSCREAVQLVLQASVLTDGGEVFVLDMGEPVRIVELAERLILLAGRTPGHDVDIEFVGTRPGEKLEEELVGGTEDQHPTAHPKVQLVRTEMIDRTMLDQGIALLRVLGEQQDSKASAEVLRDLARPTPRQVLTLSAEKPRVASDAQEQPA